MASGPRALLRKLGSKIRGTPPTHRPLAELVADVREALAALQGARALPPRTRRRLLRRLVECVKALSGALAAEGHPLAGEAERLVWRAVRTMLKDKPSVDLDDELTAVLDALEGKPGASPPREQFWT